MILRCLKLESNTLIVCCFVIYRAVSQFQPWSGDQAAAESYCAGWCGQNIDSSFVGMNVAQRKDPINQAASYQCKCHSSKLTYC